VDTDVLPPAILAGRRSGEAVTIPVGTPLRDAEMMLLRATLDHTGGNKEQAARILGITSRTINRKLR